MFETFPPGKVLVSKWLAVVDGPWHDGEGPEGIGETEQEAVRSCFERLQHWANEINTLVQKARDEFGEC